MPAPNPLVDLVYCFLDTNALLHSQTYDEIDWAALVGSQCVCLVLAPIVVNELDRHRNEQRNDRLKERARTLMSKLRPYLLDDHMVAGVPVPLHDDLDLLYIIKDPVVTWTELGLDSTRPDDRLIACMLDFQQGHPTASICLASRDTGCQVKAKSKGIRLVDEDLIPPLDVPSEETSEVEKLRRQLAEYAHRTPKLTFGFWDNGQLQAHVVRPQGVPRGACLSEDEVAERVAGARQKIDKVVAYGRKVRPAPAVDAYVREGEAYLERLACALRMQRSHASGPVCHLTFALQNSGAAPATDVVLDVTFPSGSFVVRADDGHDDPWGKVLLPTEPPEAEWMEEVRRNAAQRTSLLGTPDLSWMSRTANLAPLFMSRLPASPPPSGPRGPLFDLDGDRRFVQYLHPKLSQDSIWKLKPVVVYLPPETTGGFRVKTSYRADELPRVVTQTVNVRLAP